MAQFRIDGGNWARKLSWLLRRTGRDSGVLVAVTRDDKEILLAEGYPKVTLETVAATLAELVRTRRPVPGEGTGDGASIEEDTLVADVSNLRPEWRDRFAPPTKSTIITFEAGDGCTYILRRNGWLRTPAELGVFLFVSVLLLTVFSGLLWWLHHEAGLRPSETLILECTLIAVMCAIVPCIPAAIVTFRRTTAVVAAPDGLTVGHTGLLGRRERMLPRGQITAIRCEKVSDSFRVSLRPDAGARLLVIDSAQRPHVVVSAPVEDMQWLATRLRRYFGVSATTPK